MNQVIPLLLLYLASRLNSAPRLQKYDCPSILYSPHLGGLEASFPGVVAHGVHSLTLPDIHRYFPTTKEHIRMPVVNPDLLSQEPILFSPPDFQHSFHSAALQAVDRVLTHLGDPHYDMRLYTDLEKLVHAAHMQEVWQQAGKVYTDIQEAGGIQKEGLCSCIQDVESNGIIRMLRLIALKVREPGLMYGEHKLFSTEETQAEERNDWSGNLYSYHFIDKDDDTGKLAAEAKNNPAKNINDWDSNLYSYHFIDKDEDSKKAAAKVKSLTGKKINDWNSNLYSYHFIDKDENAEKAAAKVKRLTDKKINDWNSNLYSYHFIDKDEETDKAAAKAKSVPDKRVSTQGRNVMRKKSLLDTEDEKQGDHQEQDDDQKEVKPLPHLLSREDWETWKANMKTMEPHMEEYSKYLAIYMHCMLH